MMTRMAYRPSYRLEIESTTTDNQLTGVGGENVRYSAALPPCLTLSGGGGIPESQHDGSRDTD